ncbi:MAG TPA: hypothetical protein DCY95_00700 [Algoriphagus sp.]|nr:hypothetical protein [Algoriphagus sp.]
MPLRGRKKDISRYACGKIRVKSPFGNVNPFKDLNFNKGGKGDFIEDLMEIRLRRNKSPAKWPRVEEYFIQPQSRRDLSWVEKGLSPFFHSIGMEFSFSQSLCNFASSRELKKHHRC